MAAVGATAPRFARVHSGGGRVEPPPFISAAALEKNPFRFDTVIGDEALELSDQWSLAGSVRTSGTATLVDRGGVRSICIRGHITASALCDCDLCLKRVTHGMDSHFELHFCPVAMIDEGGETAINRDDTAMGFYDGDGVNLSDVVREQLLLWLPVRTVCSRDCKGLCQVCGCDRNLEPCDCRPRFEDPRWDPLRQLSLER